MNKGSYNYKCLIDYCSENNIILLEQYENINIKGDSYIKGQCLNDICNEQFYKRFRRLQISGPYCIQCTKLNYIDKVKKTCLNKYGCENPFQCEEFKEKIKQTNLSKYGCENPVYSKEIQDKKKKNCFDKYGVNYTCQLNHVKEKRKESILKKYNTEYPFQSQQYQEYFKNVCLEKYGVEYPHQVPEIAEKASKNSYRKKSYILPSGKEIVCQGYEPFALEKLIKEEQISEEDIATGCKNVPQIWYHDEQNKKHRHYVDIFIPSQNRCIEVKSTWTAEKKKDNIYLKQNAAKALGYQYELWIFNAKKELVEVKF